MTHYNIFKAIQDKNHEYMELYLSAGQDKDKRDLSGYPLLMNAIIAKNYKATHTLIDAGANINAVDDRQKRTALMLSITEIHNIDERARLIKKLIKKSADLDKVSHPNDNSCTALIIAARERDFSSIQLLVNAGASLNIQDDNGYSALIFSVHRGQLDAVKFLIDAGADIHLETKIDKSTIFTISIYGIQGKETKEFLTAYQDKLKLTSVIGEPENDKSMESSFVSF